MNIKQSTHKSQESRFLNYIMAKLKQQTPQNTNIFGTIRTRLIQESLNQIIIHQSKLPAMVKTKQSFPLNLIISKLFLLSNLIIDRNFSMIICHEDILLSKIVVIIYFVPQLQKLIQKLLQGVKKYILMFEYLQVPKMSFYSAIHDDGYMVIKLVKKYIKIFIMLNLIKHQQTTLIKVPTKFMFDIVKNVDAYYQFLPGCSSSKTFNHKHNYFEGQLEIDYKLFKSSYISKVTIQQHPELFTITSISENNSVFKMLKSIWELKGDEKQCQANYSIEFLFQNPLFQHASSIFLKEVVHSTSSAFEKRAYKIFQEQQKKEYQINNRETKAPIESDRNINSDPLYRLVNKKLINEQQLNLVLKNQEILILIKQMQNLYQDQNQADLMCVEFIKEYLLQQQFKI